MAEPSTATAVATATGLAALIGWLPGVDANAVIGAFCGATLFVISAKDLPIIIRLTYLMISLLIGYLGGPPVLGQWVPHSAVSAFIASATAVTAGLRAIEGVKTLDIKSLLGGRK
ncbi:phage holin family protein [Halomonas sp. DP5Y7-2]|uniref:putative holin n=1 Tax=Halomonas sp. DP5Y7-2 TaxID=2859076 RepID=UPI001C9A1D51|nr:putative holin [Halomonas sp. DP5Y7-2]MBY5985716.1 phage holin family protein [Halomonas sp. DP5Y7-2]